VVNGELMMRKREGLFHRCTRKAGEFQFRVALSGDLRDGDVEASLAFGLLKTYVPKADSTTAKATVSE
jgi:HSP20 family protein